jgi:hypothetical protein
MAKKKQVDIMDAWFLPDESEPVPPAPEPEPIADTPVARAISQGKAAKPKPAEPIDDYIEDDEDDGPPWTHTVVSTKGAPHFTVEGIPQALEPQAVAPKKKSRTSGEPPPRPWRPTEAEMKDIKPIRAQSKMMHMMKYRVGVLVGVRCGIVYKIDGSMSQLDQGITAWEKMLTCPNCELAPKSEWEPK